MSPRSPTPQTLLEAVPQKLTKPAPWGSGLLQHQPSWEHLGPPPPHRFATSEPPHVCGREHVPHIAVRGWLQLSMLLTWPQFLPTRVQKLGSSSGVQLPPQTFGVVAPQYIGNGQTPQFAVRG